jgi:hypothetical protein
MLALSLQRLQAAWSVPDDVRIYLDTCSATKLDEVEKVRDEYFPTALIFRAGKHQQTPSGCWNILNAIKSGYETGAEYVFLVEEDVMAYPDMFLWHWANQGYLTATCGRRWKYYKSDFYTNPGSCLNRSLLEHVVPHINDDFFADRRGYMNRIFGEMDEASDLDDGLIRRTMRLVGAKLVYPDSPVCAHQGFAAYQKFVEYKTHGTVDEKIEQLRMMLPKIDPNGRYTKDYEPYRWSRQRGLNGTHEA